MTQPPPSLAVGTVTNLALVSYYSLMSFDVMAAIRAGTGLGLGPHNTSPKPGPDLRSSPTRPKLNNIDFFGRGQANSEPKSLV